MFIRSKLSKIPTLDCSVYLKCGAKIHYDSNYDNQTAEEKM